jgi:uncharacterized protein (TIGR02145 family)
MLYWNGTAWFKVAAGSNGQTLIFSGGKPVWSSYTITGSLPSNTVFNATTNKIWMDRNLGAAQVATSSTDAVAYGDLYQWGRAADGHQIRNSAPISSLSSADNPNHGDFIKVTSGDYDWRSPQNTNLWQGVTGTNNPCPSGYRLPTDAEWEAERLSWTNSGQNSAGAFASPLKLPMAGRRNFSAGSLFNVGADGRYWSSTVSGSAARSLDFSSSSARMFAFNRATGFAVRCIKD